MTNTSPTPKNNALLMTLFIVGLHAFVFILVISRGIVKYNRSCSQITKSKDYSPGSIHQYMKAQGFGDKFPHEVGSKDIFLAGIK